LSISNDAVAPLSINSILFNGDSFVSSTSHQEQVAEAIGESKGNGATTGIMGQWESMKRPSTVAAMMIICYPKETVVSICQGKHDCISQT
jgi:hypothetical protein